MTVWTLLCGLLIWPLFIGGVVMGVRYRLQQRRLEREAAERRRFIEEQIRRAGDR